MHAHKPSNDMIGPKAVAVPYSGTPVGCTYCAYAVSARGPIARIATATMLVGSGKHARELCATHAERAARGWRP